MKIAHIIHLIFVVLGIFLLGFFVIPPTKINAAPNCSLNIYPQPTFGTHRYTVTLTNNTSIPGYSFINNYRVDGQASGNPSNAVTSPYNYWSLATGLGYQVNGNAGIPVANNKITYEVDLTFNNAFNGVDIALLSKGSSSFDICSQGYETYAVTYDNLSLTPTSTPTPANPLPPTPSSCSLNIYPQPTSGTHHYMVTLTNNTSTPGYKFINNYWVDGQASGSVSNVETFSDWYIHSPIVTSPHYQIIGTVGTPIANSSVTYGTDLTFNNTFNGVDIALQSQGSSNFDICSQGHEAYAITYNNLNSPTPTPTPTPKTPLILIPGIGGSEFKSSQTFTSRIKDCGIFPTLIYSVNDIVWVNKGIAAISLCDDYFDVLKLKADGKTPEYPQIVLNNTLFEDAYGGTIKFFTDNGYEMGKTLFIFPYDWRKDIGITKSDLDNKINQIKAQTGNAKVDIVAHSMGGLVARNYIADITKAQNIDKLFTLGTPHLGSVEILKTLQYGNYFGPNFLFGLVGLNPTEVKDVMQNFTGGFELIPTKKYFEFYSGEDSLHPFPFRDDSDIDNNNVTGALNFSQIKTLLANLGRNTSLFNPAEAFHALDNNLINTNGVEVINIVGSGIPTLGQIIERYSTNFLVNKSLQKDEMLVNGDQTVPLFSASLNDSSRNLSLLGSAKVFYTKQGHGNLVSSGPALNLIKNILSNNSQLPTGISNQPYHFSGTEVSVHSPVNINVYDSLGNHTGPTVNGDFEANIPGSFYDTLGDAKFIFLPDGGVYTIKFKAIDRGSFDFKIRKFENDINTIAVLYNNVPLTNSTKGQTVLDTSATQPPTLQIDRDGNGTVDKNVNPTFVLTGNAVYDVTPPEAKIFVDQDKQDLVVTGIDTNPTTVVRLDNTLTKKKNDAFYLITDAAGNSLKLDVREVDNSKQDRFRIYSVQYNNGPIKILESNHFNVTYSGKRNKLNVKEQNFELKGEVKIRIQYDAKRNKSTVIVRETKQERVKEVRNGLTILELDTNKGKLEISY